MEWHGKYRVDFCVWAWESNSNNRNLPLTIPTFPFLLVWVWRGDWGVVLKSCYKYFTNVLQRKLLFSICHYLCSEKDVTVQHLLSRSSFSIDPLKSKAQQTNVKQTRARNDIFVNDCQLFDSQDHMLFYFSAWFHYMRFNASCSKCPLSLHCIGTDALHKFQYL